MKEIFVHDYGVRLLNLKSLILRRAVIENVGPMRSQEGKDLMRVNFDKCDVNVEYRYGRIKQSM